MCHNSHIYRAARTTGAADKAEAGEPMLTEDGCGNKTHSHAAEVDAYIASLKRQLAARTPEPINPASRTLDVERALTWLKRQTGWETSGRDERWIAELLHDYSLTVQAEPINQQMLEALGEAKEFIENLQLPDPEWSRVLDVVVGAIEGAAATGGTNGR